MTIRRNQLTPIVMAGVGLLCAVLSSCGGRPSGSSGLAVGEIMPPLEAEGWFNGEPPPASELQGKVLVVDAWAYWCGPCRKIAPALVRLHSRYQKEGVVFIGLTQEGVDSFTESKKFLASAGVTWPNGYGADTTLEKLKVSGIPAIWVVGHDGKIVWNFDSPGEPDAFIDKALEAARQAAKPKK